MEPRLRRVALKYVWWESPERAVARPERLLCQLMQLGTWEDVRWARRRFGDRAFKQALRNAPAGVLDKLSWSFWNRFFGFDPVPPIPSRALP